MPQNTIFQERGQTKTFSYHQMPRSLPPGEDRRQSVCEGKSSRLKADFSKITMGSRAQWILFKVVKVSANLSQLPRVPVLKKTVERYFSSKHKMREGLLQLGKNNLNGISGVQADMENRKW